MVQARVAQPFGGDAEVAVTLSPGLSSSAIASRLADVGVVPDAWTFRAAVWRSGAGRRLKAGPYRFRTPLSPLQVVDLLVRGEVDLVRVTFPEGLTLREMAAVAEAHGYGPARTFLAAASERALIDRIDPGATSLEGYLFPDTYALRRDASPRDLVQAMAARGAQVLSPALRARAASRGWSLRQWVTLASVVEKETARPDERPIVAAVYANRLRVGMPLQCDPTVVYALQRAGRWDGNIRKGDLAIDSPYNTYRFPGLPPGPIAAPGLGALEAAAAPADVPYLYFVSRNDGTHAFAKTLAEHNRNVQQWQVAYFRAQRRAAGATR